MFALFLAQQPAAVSNINILPSPYSATVSWEIPISKQESSYITHVILYINGEERMVIDRRIQITITNLSPSTHYTVGIRTQDGSQQKSTNVDKTFTTREAGKNKIRLNKTCVCCIASTFS